MAKTTRLCLQKISDWHNVSQALHRACRGKRLKPDVQKVLRNPETAITRVSDALNRAEMPVGNFSSFTIFDPKQRIIHAAPFLDRIAHHAIVSQLEPTFERVLLPSVFACRVGKGVHTAITHAQHQARRSAWVMHIDIAKYFPSIDHRILQQQLERRFRGNGLELLDAVIAAHNSQSGKGLPIGALTSQHFANHYLNTADRWCLAQPGITAHCRYMDDFLLWSHSKQTLQKLKNQFVEFLHETLKLVIKQPLIQRSDIGILYCGVRVKPFSLRPSLRRRRRYKYALKYWQQQWQSGVIDSQHLQLAYDAIQAILLPADDKQWRLQCLKNLGAVDA